MKRFSTTARRLAAVTAIAGAAGLAATTAAVAAPASGTVLAARTTATAAVRACTAEDLGVWFAVDQNNGGAGSVYFPLQFTNLSHHACAMHGFPGVVAIRNEIQRVGAPAQWDRTKTPRTVVLAAGATAHAMLRYSDVATSMPSCHATTPSELSVIPPNQRQATHAEFDLQACANAKVIYMSVGPIIPGPGTKNG